MKHRLFIIILSIALTSPVYAELDEDIVYPQNTGSMEEVIIDDSDTMSSTREDLSNNSSESVSEEVNDNESIQEEPSANNLISTRYKKPVSKRKIAKKFLIAMSGVLISSFLIYTTLYLYNRIRNGLGNLEQLFDSNEDKSLEVPDDIFEAVNKFTNMTKWK